jgi:hypothetical protein
VASVTEQLEILEAIVCMYAVTVFDMQHDFFADPMRDSANINEAYILASYALVRQSQVK